MAVSPWIIVVVILAIFAQIPFLHELLIWDRYAIESGQWWRLVTGNLTHTNGIHLLLNLMGLIVLAFLHHSYYRGKAFWSSIWCMMVLIGCAMFFSSFSTYAGLSGVLHGLFVFGIVRDIQQRVPLGWLMLFGVLIKLCFEYFSGGDNFTAEMINASVAYQAHWVGALIGLLFALCSSKSQTTLVNEPD